jgi:cell division protein FtsQ
MFDNIRVMQKITAVLALAGTLGLLYAGVLWLADRPLFAIKAVKLEGEVQHLNAVTVRNAVVKRMKGTFFTANLNEGKRLVEGLPWVRRAQITRSWPSTILIRIEEHKPVALFNDDELVNTFGESFTVNLEEVRNRAALPQFNGPEDASLQMATRYRELTQWLGGNAALGALRIEKLNLSDRRSWSAHLTGGLVLELGRDSTPTAVAEAVSRLTRYWDGATTRLGTPTRVDLRYPDGFAFSAPGLRTLDTAAKQKQGT